MFGSLISRRARQPVDTFIQRQEFVYVLEGAVVLELDSKPPQTFKAGEAFAEMPNEIHNFRNASATEPAKALGFQYAGKGQALQINAP